MATKTFKIGLSNTDKTNMAQDVYERLIAMCFDEYDSSKTYNTGDFVVYESPANTFKLYKCNSDNVTGAWDSSKWDLATFQDLVDDIENAVAFVNDKANVDGNYPTMTVGAADNLTPYDEDSGVDQEQPFLLQGTGCGNGEQQVDTGALGLLKEKQGHSVVVNQRVKTKSLSFTTTNTSAENLSDEDYTFISGHKYLITASQSITLTSVVRNLVLINVTEEGLASLMSYGSASGSLDLYATEDVNLSAGFKASIFSCSTSVTARLQYWCSTPNADVTISEINVIDLTQWFGSNDNIPAHLLAHPEDFFHYYQGSLAYNEGTLVNSNGRYLKTIGRNQWDEEWESGYINQSTGENQTASDALRSKNYIKVVPNSYYYIKAASATTIYLYDKDKNFISADTGYSANRITIPSNCCYLRFAQGSLATPVTYNHDITISIYYEGESGYDQYYPYEELANIDTGTEVLRSAGSVKDSKVPDGTITRRVGYVDLGECSFSAGGDTHTFMLRLDDMNNSYGRYNFVCAKFDNVGETTYALYTDKGNLKVAKESGGHILYFSYEDASTPADFKTAMSGVMLYYELAEPTTEQGTTFSENVAIDDFGSMSFEGTNGVPQGNLIFYAVDYKAFVDSLYNTLDGDATDIVKESELDSKLATLGYVKLTSVSGYDATKTQVLKNVEGTLTWVTEE